MERFEPYLERREGSKELVVVLHGMRNRSQRLEAVRDVLRTSFDQVDIYAPLLPIRRVWCRTPAEDEVARLMGDVEAIWALRADTDPYRSITFVGHSIGAIFARKLCILAHGEQYDVRGVAPAPFEAPFSMFIRPRAWAPRIRRLVLLAGMNRGWLPTSARNWALTTLLGLAQLFGEVLGGKLTIFAIRKGAPFLVQTRLQWLALMNRDFGARPDLTVVQLLGSTDNEVAPDDTVDFSIDDASNNGATSTYNYLEVPHSGHSDIVEMAVGGPSSTREARAQRRRMFQLAFAASAQELATHRIERSHLQDSLPPPPEPYVEDMVFVMHGIRDKGYWTRKVARAIKVQAGARRFESWTESYGYFAMLPFVLKFVRKRKVEWLMDRYCEARARYPNARFHYVGHSNGTYLAARALLDYPSAKFARIVFAGSVVRCDYDWSTLIDQGRVDKVLNYVATRDWVVAIFPKGLQALRYFDLGSAGHDGFADLNVYQVRHIEGSHGAATEERAWSDIARFVVDGAVPDDAAFSKERSGWWVAVGYVSPGILMGAVAGIVAFLAWLAGHVAVAVRSGEALAAVCYTLLILTVLGLMRMVLLRV